jgi:hypothetical protein
LTKEKAIAEAEKYCLEKLGPQFRQLSENEMRMFESVAATNRLSALVLFIQARLPDEMADKFLSLGATGDEFAIQQFAADEKISSVIEEAISYCWYWANTKAKGDFFDYVRKHDDGRLWSFLLLDSLWNQYQTSSAIDRLAQEDPPTPEELDGLSDEQVSDLLTRTRRLKNQER